MSDATPASRTWPGGFWALLAAGELARAAFLTSASLWNDEAATLVVSRFPLRELPAKVVAIESMPPLYFFLVHFALKVAPDGLLAMRLLSLLFGAAALALFWPLARRLCPQARWPAMTLACAASSWIHASQDGRPYSLALLLAIADYLLVLDLSREWSARKAALLAAVSSAALCAHYHLGLLVAGNAVFFILAFRRRPGDLARRLAALIPAAATAACLLPMARAQAAAFSSLNLLSAPASPRQALEVMGQWLFDPSFLGLSLRPVMLAAGALTAALLAGAGLRAEGRSPAWRAFWAHAAAAFLGLRLLEGALGTPLTQARYLLFLSPLFFCALADAARALARPAKLCVVAAFAGLVLSGTGLYFLSTTALDPHLSGLAKRVRALPGRPPIVHLHSFDYLPLRYYYLPEYRHYLIASQAAHLKGDGLPGGSGVIDDAGLGALGACLVIDPQGTLFPGRWGSARGAFLAQALRVAGR